MWASQVVLEVKNLVANAADLRNAGSQGQEDSLEKGMATYSSILAWRIPWTEEPSRLWFHRVAKSWTQLKQLSTHT